MENQEPKWRTRTKMENQKPKWRTKNQNGEPKTKMKNQKPKWRTKNQNREPPKNQNGEPKTKMVTTMHKIMQLTENVCSVPMLMAICVRNGITALNHGEAVTFL